jgi:hypothetical protein
MVRSTETAPIDSASVFDDGITSFRHMPHLPHAPHAAALMTQIAQNFVPIIRQRGYDIRTVSELCCCGDGLDYLLGGGKYCVPVGQNIGGHTASDVGGYNRLEPTRGSFRVHSIHLRLRCVDNHDYLRTSLCPMKWLTVFTAITVRHSVNSWMTLDDNMPRFAG